MKTLPNCEQEPLVIEAVRSGQWDEELQNHAAGCPVCGDAALVAHFFEQVSGQDQRQSPVPEAGRVWWKAQLLARREAIERVNEPIAIVERVALACVVVSLVGLGIWEHDLIAGWLRGFATLWPQAGRLVPEFILSLWQQSSFILLASGALVFFSVSFLAYLAWTEE